MSEILAFMPTFSPNDECHPRFVRPYTREGQEAIKSRLGTANGRLKPGVYLDAIDSILNIRPDIHLVVGDGRSTESIRSALQSHNQEAIIEHNEMLWSGHDDRSAYTLEFYPKKMSQWKIFNDVYKRYATPDMKYFVYTSSDVVWLHDWVSEAIKEFDKNPKLMILFPTVSSGDGNIPCQVASGPRDLDLQEIPYDIHGKGRVLNMYSAIFRREFLDAYGGYISLFRNNFSESFLDYMCEAMEGEMRLMPRGWAWHWGTVDYWKSESGSPYFFAEEKDKFDITINKVLMMHGAGFANVPFLKNLLCPE